MSNSGSESQQQGNRFESPKLAAVLKKLKEDILAMDGVTQNFPVPRGILTETVEISNLRNELNQMYLISLVRGPGNDDSVHVTKR